MTRRRHDSMAVRGRRARRSFMRRLARLVRYRLIIPVRRSRHSPEYTARGVAVGVAVGLTPTVGIQMAISLAIWMITRRLFRWDFNVILACAWTWISNVVTMVPMYYVFYVTGQLMLGRWDDLSGYRIFADDFTRALNPPPILLPGFDILIDPSFEDTVEALLAFFVKDIFLVMTVGSIPFVIAGGLLSYRWSLNFVTRHREQRKARHGRRRVVRQGAGE